MVEILELDCIANDVGSRAKAFKLVKHDKKLVRFFFRWKSSKTSQSRLAKMSGRMNSLYFGASFAPRIEHAASQIQDSRDLLLLLVATGVIRFSANST